MKKTRAQVLQERLKSARKRYKSDNAFAEAVGVKNPTMYKWLKSTPVWPDEPNLRIIANYFGISVDRLVAECEESQGGKVKENGATYNVATYENITKLIDRLPTDDKKRIAVYSIQSIAV